MNKLCLVLITAFLLVACQKPPDSAHAPHSTYEAAEFTTLTANILPESQIITQEENNPHLKNRLLAVNGEISFETSDVLKTNSEIENLTLKHGGYIQNSQIANQENSTHTLSVGHDQKKQLISYNRHANVIVRIPKQNVAAFLTELSPLMEFLEYRNFLAEDVKLDIQKSLLQAKIQSEKQQELQHIDNSQEKTTIITQNASAKEEQMYADLQKMMLEDKVKFTTITLKFHEAAKVTQKTIPDIDSRIKQESNYTFFSQLKNSLADGWYYFLQLILLISKLWVIILATCAGLYAVCKWLRRRKKVVPTHIKEKTKHEL